ncbi:VWA domain-containing protein [bacterium]|nr:VWA domain-containing protein [bacterium]MBU1983927.1 VWA domain-containing protein [bacterium]
MIRFEHPLLLWFLLLVPVWVFAWQWLLGRRKRLAERFVSGRLMDRVAASFSERLPRLKAMLWVLVWSLLIVGAANPQIGTKLEEVKREGIDIILAVDVSSSMQCEDIAPSRLESSKHEILQLLSGLKGDRVGIVAFAGSAIMHCPLTTDYGAVRLLVRVLEPNLVPEPGTALAEAMSLAKRSFNAPDVKSRVLVIITDGEDHEEQAIETAREIAAEGIRIYTIGMGTPQGAPIPLKDERGRDVGFKRDKNGVVVVTRLNEVLMDRVAQAGGGKYLRGTSSGRELGAIWADIGSMEKQEFGKKQFAAFEDRFQYFVLPALLLFLAEFFVPERKGRRRRTRIALPHAAEEVKG